MNADTNPYYAAAHAAAMARVDAQIAAEREAERQWLAARAAYRRPRRSHWSRYTKGQKALLIVVAILCFPIWIVVMIADAL